MFAFLIRIISKIGFPYFREVSNGEISNLSTNVLSKGDLIFTFTPYKLANMGISGEYKHVAMYVGDSMIVHATTGGGTSMETLRELISDSSRYAVYRLNGITPDESNEVSAIAKDLSDDGIGYDFRLKKGNPYYYCSELVHFVYSHIGNYIDFSGNHLVPVDIYANGKWEIVHRNTPQERE